MTNFQVKSKRQLYAIYHSVRQKQLNEAKGSYWIPTYKWQLVEWLTKHYQSKPTPKPSQPKQLQFWFDTSEGRSTK